MRPDRDRRAIPRPARGSRSLGDPARRAPWPDDEGYALFSGGAEGSVIAAATILPMPATGTTRRTRPSGARSRRRHRLRSQGTSQALPSLTYPPPGNSPMARPTALLDVYNGEIYNYIELRQELGALGTRSATQTDTK